MRVALGIGIDGTKHPLAGRGSTENTSVVTDLLTGCVIAPGRHPPIFVGIDGGKALRAP